MRTHDFQRMRIAVPLETAPGELRVALTPDSVVRLVKAGHEIKIQAGAGERAGFPDSVYAGAGATILDGAALYDGVTLVCRVQPPSPDEVALMPRDVSLLSLLNPARNRELLQKLADRGITALALERVPRITRAQSMDVLSSQATVAGYKAVLIGAAALPKLLPMLTTAAGTLAPAKVFVIGAGVAGLQAIATARRLGAVVSAFDVRAAARRAGPVPRRHLRRSRIDLGGRRGGAGRLCEGPVGGRGAATRGSDRQARRAAWTSSSRPRDPRHARADPDHRGVWSAA